MKIYVAHSTSFDYKKQLYAILRQSSLNKKTTIILPHEKKGLYINSKLLLQKTDLMIAEISYPSTGLGIEMGWANFYEVPIIALYKKTFHPSQAAKKLAKQSFAYSNAKTLKNALASIEKTYI